MLSVYVITISPSAFTTALLIAGGVVSGAGAGAGDGAGDGDGDGVGDGSITAFASVWAVSGSLVMFEATVNGSAIYVGSYVAASTVAFVA